MTEKANHLEQELQRHGKAELITIIRLMLQQRPELSWVLQAPQPVTGKHVLSINAHLYRQQIEAVVSVAVEHYRDRAYREALRNTLVTIQTATGEFTQKTDYLAALSIYEVLVAEAVKYYFAVETGSLLFTPIFAHCIDGLDSCVAEAGENQEMCLRAFRRALA